MITHHVEILVAGLGPAGSVAALHLARQGIKVAALEATPGAVDLRASTFHSPTVEMLDDLGAAETLKTQGLKAPVYQYRDRASGEVFAFDLGELADHTRFPYRIQCEQHLVVQEIIRELEREPTAMVCKGQRLLFFVQGEDEVTAYVETPHAIECYVARYLIGADGANSIARKALDLGFPGFTYDEKFLCLSTEHPLEQSFKDLSYVNYISDPDEWLVLLKVPRLWRVLVPATRPDPELLSDEYKDAIFRRILGSDVRVTTHHRTIYRVHQRVCSSFAKGRVCLVGDSAHLNSPMGGFGMNSGIHDAVNLCDKLGRILRHGGDPRLLELYDRQRRTVTNDFIQAQTIENTKAMSEGWGAAREGRRQMLGKLQADDDARRRYLLKQSMFTSLKDAAAIA